MTETRKLFSNEKGNTMTVEEQKQVALEKYASIQRIKRYGDEELNYQERLAIKELNNLGISVEDITLEKAN